MIIITLFLLKYISFNLSIYLLIIIQLFKIFEEIKRHFSLFNKFLLERFLYDLSFKKTLKIKELNANKMMRDKKHIFFNGNRFITEKELLNHRFKP
jgi:hypothetical protein